jgi:hypothetical protein
MNKDIKICKSCVGYHICAMLGMLEGSLCPSYLSSAESIDLSDEDLQSFKDEFRHRLTMIDQHDDDY